MDDWAIQIFYSVNQKDYTRIEEALMEMDCPEHLLEEAEETICSGEPNFGLTYTNLKTKYSIMIIGEVSSFQEIINTAVHETYHLVEHIKLGERFTEEETASFVGKLSAKICDKMFKLFNEL